MRLSHTATAGQLLSDTFIREYIVWNFIHTGTDEERAALVIMEEVLAPLTNQLAKWEFD